MFLALSFGGQGGEKQTSSGNATFIPTFPSNSKIGLILCLPFCSAQTFHRYTQTTRLEKCLFTYQITSILFILQQAFVIICPPNGGKVIQKISLAYHYTERYQKNEKAGLMKDNSTTNHEVLSHTQIKSMMKPLQIKLNSGLTTGGFFCHYSRCLFLN